MSEKDKESKIGSNTLRAVLHFLSGRLGAEDEERAVIRKRFLFGAVLGIALAADLVTKWAAFRFLRVCESVSVIPGFFDLHPVWNTGIVFGIPAPMWVTILVSVVATVVVVKYLATPRGRPAIVQLYLSLILSGVIGNLYDRIVLVYPPHRVVTSFWDYFKSGAVRDFIELYVGKHHWPNFNLADAFILIGVVLAMIQFILAEDKKKAKTGEEAPAGTAGEPVQEGTGQDLHPGR